MSKSRFFVAFELLSICFASFSFQGIAYAMDLDSTLPSGSNGNSVNTNHLSCQDYDKLQPVGTQAPLISTCDSLVPDWGGARDVLDNNGWLIQGTFASGVTYDVLDHRAHPQLYLGQDPSYSATLTAYAMYDLSRIGFSHGSELITGAWAGAFSYSQQDPRGASLIMLYVNQPFYNGHLQVQYGYDSFVDQFYGFYPGGNTTASAALGVTSVIPIEVGILNNKPAPEINLRAATESGFYDRFGVTRSMSPDGILADWDANNAWGLKWHIPGASALFINEIGYQIDPSQSNHMAWLRQGIIYNESDYVNFSQSNKKGNYAFYIGGDYQLVQTDPSNAGNGLYINSMYDYAPADRNIFQSDFSVTLYAIGAFKSRPNDTLSFGYSHNWLSKTYQAYEQAQSQSAADFSYSYAVSYVFHVSRGVFWTNQLSYTHNPTVVPRLPSSLNWMTQLALSF